jgi:hypothetical protein
VSSASSRFLAACSGRLHQAGRVNGLQIKPPQPNPQGPVAMQALSVCELRSNFQFKRRTAEAFRKRSHWSAARCAPSHHLLQCRVSRFERANSPRYLPDRASESPPCGLAPTGHSLMGRISLLRRKLRRRDAHRTHVRAEVGFAVADEYQHRGAATLLLQQLVSVARCAGIREFGAQLLDGNVAMIRVLENSRRPLRQRIGDRSPGSPLTWCLLNYLAGLRATESEGSAQAPSWFINICSKINNI